MNWLGCVCRHHEGVGYVDDKEGFVLRRKKNDWCSGGVVAVDGSKLSSDSDIKRNIVGPIRR